MATIDEDKVRTRLREREDELKARLEEIPVTDAGMLDSELADYDQHPADQGTETFEQELDQTTALIMRAELQDVETARKRLDEGKYGICIDGGEEIPPERLEAKPEAIRCIKHQNIYEGQLRARGGPPLQSF